MTSEERISPPTEQEDIETTSSGPTAQDVIGTVSDTVVGVNVRGSDNIIQLVCIFVGASLGALIGGLGWGGIGAMLGAIIGVVAMLLLSGLGIGIYRLIKRIGG